MPAPKNPNTRPGTAASQHAHAERAVDDDVKRAKSIRVVQHALARKRISPTDIVPVDEYIKHVVESAPSLDALDAQTVEALRSLLPAPSAVEGGAP